MESRFRKVAQKGGTYVVATFVDTNTWEVKTECVRDYDYSDGSRDNDDLYFMPIDEEAKWMWLHHNGVIQVGDEVEVVKGKKVPIGTVGKATKVYDVYDKYKRWVAKYVAMDNGYKTNVDNCKLKGE